MPNQVDAVLPFLLHRENIARYEEGAVLVFNRRGYRHQREEEG